MVDEHSPLQYQIPVAPQVFLAEESALFRGGNGHRAHSGCVQVCARMCVESMSRAEMSATACSPEAEMGSEGEGCLAPPWVMTLQFPIS